MKEKKLFLKEHRNSLLDRWIWAGKKERQDILGDIIDIDDLLEEEHAGHPTARAAGEQSGRLNRVRM